MESEKKPKKSQVIDSKGKRDYDPFEDIRRKYQTPGTVIRGDELPNNQPYMRPLTEQEMKDLKKKGYAKGGFVPFAKKGEKKPAAAKANPFAGKMGKRPMKLAKGGMACAPGKKMAHGGAVKKYAAGGAVARGMGCALRGGKYST